MVYYKLPPSVALAGIVRFFWILEGGAFPDAPLHYRLFADGCPGLLVQYGNRFSDYTQDGLQPVPTCFYHGPTADHSETTVTGEFGLLGAYFHPSATRLLTGIPARELSNQTLDAALLWGRMSEVEERVLAAKTAQERVSVLSEFLIERLRRVHQHRNRTMERVVQRLLRVRSGLSVETMADDTGLSLRQFERKFTNEVGLPPKLFSRVIRFQGTILAAGNSNIHSLTDLAYASGYSDQSHFIRDFREFSGMNPRQYFSHLDKAAESLVRITN